MEKAKTNAVVELINERIRKINGDDSEDLNYIHVFFPKINTLIGTEGCLKIYNGEEPEKVFLEAGLHKQAYESIVSLVTEGKRISDEDNSLELLNEIDKRSDVIFMGYVNIVRKHLIENNKDITKFDLDVNNFFNNDNVIFTSLDEYEKEKNIVK